MAVELYNCHSKTTNDNKLRKHCDLKYNKFKKCMNVQTSQLHNILYMAHDPATVSMVPSISEFPMANTSANTKPLLACLTGVVYRIWSIKNQ